MSRLFDELEGELKHEIEIESKIGKISKITFFRDNPAGVCKIKFDRSIDAEECIKLMTERFFDGRILKCFYWDGKTDFKKVKESEQII